MGCLLAGTCLSSVASCSLGGPGLHLPGTYPSRTLGEAKLWQQPATGVLVSHSITLGLLLDSKAGLPWQLSAMVRMGQHAVRSTPNYYARQQRRPAL